MKSLQCGIVACLTTAFIGCRDPDVIHTYTVSAPDIAVYDGVVFSSMDGLVVFTEIVIFPQETVAPVRIRLPDGEVVDSGTLTREVLERHVAACAVGNDDGRGNYTCQGSGMHVIVDNGIVQSVAISSDHGGGAFGVEVRGKTIQLPINRSELDGILGKPDIIREHTYPEELRRAAPGSAAGF